MTKLNRRAALSALAGAAAAVPAISLATPLSDPLAGLPGSIAAKVRTILNTLPPAGGDAQLFAALHRYETARAAKWAVLARVDDDDDEHERDHEATAEAEFATFCEVADFPATTLAGVLAKALVVLEDLDHGHRSPDDFGNMGSDAELVAKSLIRDWRRLGVQWAPQGLPEAGDAAAAA